MPGEKTGGHGKNVQTLHKKPLAPGNLLATVLITALPGDLRDALLCMFVHGATAASE